MALAECCKIPCLALRKATREVMAREVRLSLRGGQEGLAEAMQASQIAIAGLQANVSRYWKSVSAVKKRQFASLAQKLDAWLQRERGVPLREARRPLILEALHACQRRPPSSDGDSVATTHEAEEAVEEQDAGPERAGEEEDACRGRPADEKDQDRERAGKSGSRLDVEECNEVLWLACQVGDVGVVKSAIADGAHVNSADDRGWTALHFATNANQIAVIQSLLVDLGADAGAADESGVTPLMLAADHGFGLAVEQLIIVGSSDTNSREKEQGLTALHLAAARGHTDTACTLYLHGANLAALDSAGRRAEECAELLGYTGTADRLRRLRQADEETHAAVCEQQRQFLSPHEARIARDAGFSLHATLPPCDLRARYRFSSRIAGFSLHATMRERNHQLPPWNLRAR